MQSSREHELTPCSWLSRKEPVVTFASVPWADFIKNWRSLLTRYTYVWFSDVKTNTERAIAHQFMIAAGITYQRCVVGDWIAVCRRHKTIMSRDNLGFDRYITDCSGREVFYRNSDCRPKDVYTPMRRVLARHQDAPELDNAAIEKYVRQMDEY